MRRAYRTSPASWQTGALVVSPTSPGSRPRRYLTMIEALVAAALLFGAAHSTAQPRPALELPPSSTLRPVDKPGARGGVAFDGNATIHGVLVAQWKSGPGGRGPARPSFRLLPVSRSAAQLPHFKDIPLRFVDVPNGRDILARATSASIAKAFDARERAFIHVEGLFSITKLELGTTCAAAGTAEVTDVDPIGVHYPDRPETVDCAN
jgi:hypothetical protein